MPDDDGPTLGPEYTMAPEVIAQAAAKVAAEASEGASDERIRLRDRVVDLQHRLTQLDGANPLQAKLDGARTAVNEAWVRALQRLVIEDPDFTGYMADYLCTAVGVPWRPPELTVYGRVNFHTRVRGIDPRSFDKDHPQMLAQEQIYVQVAVEGMVADVSGVEDSTEVDDFLINRVEWSYE